MGYRKNLFLQHLSLDDSNWYHKATNWLNKQVEIVFSLPSSALVRYMLHLYGYLQASLYNVGYFLKFMEAFTKEERVVEYSCTTTSNRSNCVQL